MTDTIETGYGALRGEDNKSVTVFRGIPYALPPIHELRFAAPEPAKPWQGVRDATTYGAAAMQLRPQQATSAFGGMFGPGQLPVSEDCLYLNVWVPRTSTPNKPVMVWIHGGAFRMGTGGSPMYEASRLAAKGNVIVVTLNYRLGSLGFAYAPGEIASNAGLRDQIAALQWVRQEIGAFGGDSDNITLFGESAGAKSVECLMASPMAKGLFARVILESTYAPDMRPGSATGVTQGLLDAVGANDIKALRAAPTDSLLDAQRKVQEQMAAGGVAAGFLPVVDGEVIPGETLDAISEGAGSTVPAIIGTNRDESRLFGALMMQQTGMDERQLRERMQSQYPAMTRQQADALIDAYAGARSARGEPASPLDVWFALSTDRMFRIHSLQLTECLAQQQNVRSYLFNWRSPEFGGMLGACHGLELPFVFGNMEGPLGKLAGTGPDAARLSETMQALWLGFARGEALPDWPAFDTSARQTMTFDATSGVTSSPLEPERRAYLEAFGERAARGP